MGTGEGREWWARHGHEQHTLHMQCGCALVHGKHVGAGAYVGARVAWLDVANGQDAVEIHGSVWQLPVVQAGPHQGVSRRLPVGRGDGMGWGLEVEPGDPRRPSPR